MADISIFNQNFDLDTTADVSFDFSASHSYTNIGAYGTAHPWQIRLVVDGADNNARGGSTAVSDVVSIMGAAGQLATGRHNVQIIWYADSTMLLRGAVLRILITKR